MIERNVQKNKELLFIKSPFLSDSPSHSNIEHYLKGVREIVNYELPNIGKSGFVAIQTQDVRINGYIEPIAKRLVDMLTINDLWLKEIIIITQKGANSKTLNSKDYLKIVHQYLLVYDVKK